MTDSRSKTKANSIVTLNRHRRGSSPTNTTIIINDDTDSDTQTFNTTGTDTLAKNLSPWKDEKLRSDFSSNDTEEDSDVLPRTPVRPITTKKSMTTGRIARKNSINKGTPVLERSIQKSNQGKLSTTGKKKSQKSLYNWSGTFCTETSSKDTHCSIYYSPRRDKLHDTDSQLTSYNYYCEDFARKKPASKEDIFYPNKFDPQIIDDSRKKWIDSSIGCQPCIDICIDNFEGCNNFKDYDTDQDNGALPAALSDVNINLRQRKMRDVNDKNKNTCDIDSRTNNSVILCSQLAYDINNINKEDDNLCNAKESVDPSINIRSNTKKIINNTKKKSVQLRCLKFWYSLLFFLKNIIFFSLLPTAYIIFFIFVQDREDKKQDNI